MKKIISAILILGSFVLVSAQTPAQNGSAPTESEKLSAELVKLYQSKKFGDALIVSQKILALNEAKFGKNSLEAAASWRNMGYVQIGMENNKDAAKSFEHAYSIYQKNNSLKPSDEKLLIDVAEAAATFDAMDGAFVSAEKKFELSLALREKNYGKGSLNTLLTLLRLGEINRAQGDYEKAGGFLTRALEISARKNVELDETGENIYYNLSCVDSKRGLKDEREKLKQRFFPAKPADSQDKNIDPQVINGGVINGRAISLPKPPYPAAARESKSRGKVEVEVLLDENGKIIYACAISGARDLQGVSENAALRSKFSPTILQGKPVRVSGIITYNFVP